VTTDPVDCEGWMSPLVLRLTEGAEGGGISVSATLLRDASEEEWTTLDGCCCCVSSSFAPRSELLDPFLLLLADAGWT
jgi:hypothetical protein